MHTDFRNYLYYNASKFQPRYSVKPILLLPLGATLHTQEVYLRRNLIQSETETINSNQLEVIRCHNIVHVLDKGIKPKREPGILSCYDQLCEQISNHLFSDTEYHLHVTQADTTSDQMVPNL
jgi:hypothetical protein